jgi:hypothetical protein
MKEALAPQMTPLKRQDNSGWLVVVTWPDKREERLNGFRSMADVTSWLDHGAPEWLAKHPRNKAP